MTSVLIGGLFVVDLPLYQVYQAAALGVMAAHGAANVAILWIGSLVKEKNW